MNVERIPAHNPGPYTGSGNNTWLVHGSRPLLIDAGVGAAAHVEGITRALEADDAPLAAVIVTHAHGDHIGGVRTLAERWPGVRMLKFPWPERDAEAGVAFEPVGDGSRVAAGDGTLVLVHTPGHAPDHLCAWDEATRTVFTGDLLIEGGTVVIPASTGGDLRKYLESLRRVRELAPDRALPAHGPPIERPVQLIDDYLVHRSRRERQVIDALASGAATPAAIVRLMYDLVPDALRPAAQESVLAHLRKLREEGVAIERTSGGRAEWHLAPRD